MVGVFVIAGDDRRAGRHPPGRAGPAEQGSGKLSGPLRTASDILSGFPSIVLGYVGYVALVVGLHWGFSLLAGGHHPLDHGDPLHRQDDRELAAPGARPATGRAPRPSACRRATACARSCSRARCPASSPGSCSRWPSPAARPRRSSTRPASPPALPHSLTHAQFPYLTYVVFTVYNDRSEANYHALLRRRPHSGGDRAPPPGGQPDHRGDGPSATPRARAPHACPRRRRRLLANEPLLDGGLLPSE